MKKEAKSLVILILLIIPIMMFLINNETDKYTYKDNKKVLKHDILDTKSPKSSGSWQLNGIHINNNWSDALLETWCNFVNGFYLIEDGTIDAGGTENGILIENSEDKFIIRNCTVYNSEDGGGDGVGNDEFAGIKLNNVTYGRLERNNCSNNLGHGIFLYKCNLTVVVENKANNNGRDVSGFYSGIHLEDSNNTIISGNNATHNLENGIVVFDSNNNTIIGNNCSNNDEYGIILRRSDNNILNTNEASFTGNLHGIALYDNSDNNLVSKNTVNNNTKAGIAIGDYDLCNNNSISGNTAKYNREDGIYIGGSNAQYQTNGSIVKNNDVISNNRHGIHLKADSARPCTYNTISTNNASFNDELGIYLTSYCNNNTVSNNYALKNGQSGPLRNGIHLFSNCNNNTITGNTMLENLGYGISIDTNSNDNIISENLVKNNTDDGIVITSNSGDTIIKKNSIEYNGDEGIDIESSSHSNIIRLNLIRNHTNTGQPETPAYGIKLESNLNLVYKNAFVNNLIHAIDLGANNQWNNSIIGNYWDNYTGPDNDGDGIGDVPYTFIRGGSQDNKPINVTAPIITINDPEPNTQHGAGAPVYNITIDWIFWWYAQEKWYTLNGGQTNTTFTDLFGNLLQSLWNNLPNGAYTLRFYVKDIAGNINFTDVTIIKYIQPIDDEDEDDDDESVAFNLVEFLMSPIGMLIIFGSIGVVIIVIIVARKKGVHKAHIKEVERIKSIQVL